MQDSTIKVSVCVVTYNQQEYIRECLESLVSQQTDFNFEIIVGDDASTDDTPRIIKEYQDKYPHLIKPVLREKNLGPVQNTLDIYKKARGQYIAHLDGDDLALLGKLQKQADVLDKYPNCIMCSHDVYLLDKKLTNRTFKLKKSGVYTLLDLYKELPFFAHSSKMFRNDLTEEYWNNFTDNALDVTVHVEQAKKGDIYHLEESYGIYRMNVGIYTKNKKINPLIVNGVVEIYDQAIREEIYPVLDMKLELSKAYYNFARSCLALKDKEGFLIYIRESYTTMSFSKKQIFLYYLSYFRGTGIGLLLLVLKLKNICKAAQ